MKAPVLIGILLLGTDSLAVAPLPAQVAGLDWRKAIDPLHFILPTAFATDKRDSGFSDAVRPPMVFVEAEKGEAALGSPIALAAAPYGPPPGPGSAPTPRDAAAPAFDLPSDMPSLNLDEPWQKLGFMAALLAIAMALFGWLGTRARQAPRVIEPIEDEPLSNEPFVNEPFVNGPRPPRRRYPTLQEAVEAMKAEAARS